MEDRLAKPRNPGAVHRLATVSRACDVIKAFADEEHTLTLAEIGEATGLEKTIVFRLVHTLEENGLLRRVEGRRYSSNIRLRTQRAFRLGFAAQTEESPFSAAVTESLRRAAARHNLDLLVLNNRYSAKVALRNAERLIAEHVDLALEFQTYERVAPAVSSLFRNAGIPLIAIDIPHPGATFFGIDNYEVGRIAGRTLARWAKASWRGQVDELLLLELEIAGSLPRLRLSGAEDEIRKLTPAIGRVVRLDSRGDLSHSLQAVRKHLRTTPEQRTLIMGVNDPAVLGALRAFEEAGRGPTCAAVSLGAIPEARAELRRPDTRLLGSVAFFPETYGERLVEMALDILHKRHVPPAVYARHRMITRANVDRIFPGDRAELDWDRDMK